MFKLAIVVSLQASIAGATVNPPHSISLLPSDGPQLLERENDITAYCPANSSNFETCRIEALKPVDYVLRVFERPSDKAPELGKIVVTIKPGRGVDYRFVQPNNSSTKVVPDFTEMTNSYFFMFTVIDKEGSWLKLPRNPFPTDVWINPKRDWGAKAPVAGPLELKTVFNAGSLGAIVFLSFNGKKVVYRDANENDRGCTGRAVKVPAEKIKPKTMPVDKLFNSDGHLIAWPQGLGGC